MSRTITPRATVIGRAKCNSCGSDQPVKVNKNGRAYFFCTGADPDGDLCHAENKLSPYVSRRMVNAYVSAPEPEPAPEPKQKSKPEPTQSDERISYLG